MTDEKDEAPTSPDVHFEPVIRLPEVNVKTMEEDEEEILKLRARLYRYATDETPAEWKERGTGDVKLLKHREKGTVRLLMRRDKTLKVCANHYILPWMELKPNCGSDRAWVWSVNADFADEEPKEEMLAIKFTNVENAKKFKDLFDECKMQNLEVENEKASLTNLTEKLDQLTVQQADASDAVQEEKSEESVRDGKSGEPQAEKEDVVVRAEDSSESNREKRDDASKE